MKKQIMFILFVLLVLFGAASVNAQDNQTNDAVTVADVDVNGNTFNDINTAINSASYGDVIYLNNKSYSGDTPIVIDRNITIDGSSVDNPNSVSILDGRGVTKILETNGNVTITLKNLVFVNGSSELGGAIYANTLKSISMSNVVFDNNTASQGGALYIKSIYSRSLVALDATNCTFSNNKCSSIAGAVYIYNTNATFNNCSFVKNSELGGNSTKPNAGAIYNYGIVNINNCLFTSNACSYGGAIVNDEKTLIINNSKFIGNIATVNDGAVIYNFHVATLKINNSIFDYNMANKKGSVIYNQLAKADIDNSIFNHNIAGKSAVIFNDGGELNITDSNFTSNIGTESSVIYNQNFTLGSFPGVVTVNHSNFNYNIPINGTEIYNSGNLNLYSSNLTGNYTLVQNYGLLNLKNNTMNSSQYLNIYNNEGAFVNPLKLIVLDNSTKKTFLNQPVEVTAILVDDNNNTIGDTSFKFSINGTETIPTLYKNGTYKENITLSKSGLYSVTAHVTSDKNLIEIRNGTIEVLPQPNLNVATTNVTYPADATISVTSSNLTNEDILLTIKDNRTNVTIYNDTIKPNVNINLKNLNAGNYTVVTSFAGDSNYSPINVTSRFQVSKAASELSIAGENVTFGNPVNFNITLENINETVNVVVNNHEYNVAITNGKGFLSVLDLGVGNYTANVKFNGNENYLNAENSTVVSVAKANPSLDVQTKNIVYGDVATVEVTSNDLDSVNITVNNVTYSVNLTDGVGSIEIPDLNAGSYSVVVNSTGNDNFQDIVKITTLDVAKQTSKLNLTINNITYGENAICNVVLTNGNISIPKSNSNETVNVIVNNKSYAVKLTNGVGSVEIPDLNAGNYTAIGYYNGNENYMEATDETTFEVKDSKAILNIEIDNVTYGDIAKVNVTLKGDNNNALNGTVTLTIDNQTYNVTIKNGTGVFEFSATIPPADYTVTGVFNQPNYENTSVQTAFTVDPIEITVTNLTTPYGVGGVVNITLSKPINGTLIVLFNNRDYSVEFKDGVGSFSIPKYTVPGNHTIVVDLDTQIAKGNVEVVNHYDLSIEKTANESTVDLNGKIVFTITVKNNDYSVYNLTVTDLIDTSKFSYVSSLASTGLYNASTGIWKIIDIQPNKTETLKLTVNAISPGKNTNHVELAIDGFNETLMANASVLVNEIKNNTDSNNTFDNTTTNNTDTTTNNTVNNNNNSLHENNVDNNISALKTANPILLLLLAMALIPLRRKL